MMTLDAGSGLLSLIVNVLFGAIGDVIQGSADRVIVPPLRRLPNGEVPSSLLVRSDWVAQHVARGVGRYELPAYCVQRDHHRR